MKTNDEKMLLELYSSPVFEHEDKNLHIKILNIHGFTCRVYSKAKGNITLLQKTGEDWLTNMLSFYTSTYLSINLVDSYRLFTLIVKVDGKKMFKKNFKFILVGE